MTQFPRSTTEEAIVPAPPAEHALSRSEVLYRTVVEQASDIILTTDEDGRLTSVNPAFTELTGWSSDEWIGRPLLEWFDSGSLGVATEQLAAVLAGETVCGDYRVRTRRGAVITLEIKARPLIVAGEVAGAIGVARDVTLRRDLEAEEEKEKRLVSLGHLAGAVAHEFNNVLMSILPFAELLKRRSKDDEKVEMATRHIFQAVRRGRQVSQEILRFARTGVVALEPVDVGEWLEQFTREAVALLGPRYVVRHTVDANEDLYISADPALLDQIASNLVLNARDAMPEGGFITIRARRSAHDPGRIEIDIRDSGCGVADNIIDRIFDPLFTTKSGATGLGLSIALQGMAQQEGTIRVDSRAGVGSTFTLVFRESAAPACAVPNAAGEAQRQRRVLLVEDDEAVGEGIRALLSDDGFEVHLVTSGHAALDAVRQFHPDVTILDVNLGDTNGLEVFEWLRKEWPDLRVVFSTGHADAASLDDVRQRRVPAIMKPYDIAELVAVIEQVVE